MSKKMRLAVACAAAALLGLAPGRARAELKVCNGGNETIRYAVVADDSLLPWLFPNWVMNGWHMLGVGSCQTLIGGARLARAYVSTQTRSATGWNLGLYGQERQSNAGSSNETVHRVFCVGEGNFSRSETELDAHSQCPAGYYRQLFNLYLWSSSSTNYTMTLQ